ncbi:MAG: c-type cytochrome domain-containing protein [Gemmataceae bacterium]
MRSPMLLLPVLFLTASSISAQPKVDPKKRTTYDEQVLPILRDKCINCHSSDKKRGGLNLANYTALMQGGSSGAAVKPGDPEGSLLYKLMAHTAEPIMPPNSVKPAPNDPNLLVVAKWIADGAPENSGSKVVITERPKAEMALGRVVKGKPAVPPMPPANMSRQPVVRTPRDTAIVALAANPWSPLLAVGGQKQVLLYHAQTLELLGVLPFPEGTPNVLKFSRNGSLLLVGGGRAGKSGKVVIFDITKGERLLAVGDETDAVLAADISPDQSQVALGGPSKLLRIFSTRDGSLLHEVKKHTDWITSLEFSPDGVLLASGDRNGGLFIWEANTAREFFALKGPTTAITEISWRPDSNVVAVASEDSSVRLFEMENGNQIRSWNAHGGGTRSVCYGMDGRIVTTGRDRVTKLWDGNGTPLRSFEALPDVGLRAVLTHDQSRTLASDWSGQLVVWNTADGKRLGVLTANPPTLAEQIAAAQAAVQAAQQNREAKAVAAKVSADALAKINADLAAAQKRVADTAAAVKAAEVNLAAVRHRLATAQQAVTASTHETRAKELLAKELKEAAARLRAEADKAKENAPLQGAALRLQTLADQANSEWTLAQKALGELQAALQAFAPQVASAEAAHQAAVAAAAEAPKAIPALTMAQQAAASKAQADVAALTAAEANLHQAKEALAKLTPPLAPALAPQPSPAPAPTPVPPKK